MRKVDKIDGVYEMQVNLIKIKTATPYMINTKEKDDGTVVGILTFLCTDETDSLFTLSRNYIIEFEEDEEYISSIPFHSDNMFSNAIICYQQIINHCPSYISDFNFFINNIHDNVVYLNGVNTSNKVVVKFEASPNVFASLQFIDSYVFNNNIENEYDLRMAIATASRVVEDNEFFIVDRVTDINSIASPVDPKKGFLGLFSKNNTNVLVSLEVAKEDTDEEVSILTSFDLGVSLPKDAFDTTSEEIIAYNYGNTGQFVTSFALDGAYIKGLGKVFLMIRGKNAEGKAIVFLFSNEIQENIKNKILGIEETEESEEE